MSDPIYRFPATDPVPKVVIGVDFLKRGLSRACYTHFVGQILTALRSSSFIRTSATIDA